MIACVENLRESTKNLELINVYCKVTGYKINIQKSVAFLYTRSKQVELEIKNTVPFSLVFPQTKCLCINLSKYVQCLYKENYKTLMKVIKGINKLRDPWSWIGRLIIVKVLVLPVLICRFNTI